MHVRKIAVQHVVDYVHHAQDVRDVRADVPIHVKKGVMMNVKEDVAALAESVVVASAMVVHIAAPDVAAVVQVVTTTVMAVLDVVIYVLVCALPLVVASVFTNVATTV